MKWSKLQIALVALAGIVVLRVLVAGASLLPGNTTPASQSAVAVQAQPASDTGPIDDAQMDRLRKAVAGIQVYEQRCGGTVDATTQQMIGTILQSDPQSSARWLAEANAMYAASPGPFCSVEQQNIDKLGFGTN